MQTLAPFKRGDSFLLTCTYKVEGIAQSVIGLDIASQLRNSYGMSLVDDFTVTVLEDGETNIGKFAISPSNQDTSGWPLGSLLCDVKLGSSGAWKHSDSFSIPVVERITQ